MATPLLKDKSKTPYENILIHAGMDVQRNTEEGTLTLKPKTPFVPDSDVEKSREWNIEPSIGNVEVFIRLRTSGGQESVSKMKRSYHTRGSVELAHVSQSDDWYAYETESLLARACSEETIEMSVWVETCNAKQDKDVFIRGSFRMPSQDRYDFVGSHGVLLVDPDHCLWTCFLDVMHVQYKDSSGCAIPTIVSAGLHARLGGDGPLK